jgi:targeting protein for Xklp2
LFKKVYVREQAAPAPFVSMAEMMKKFQSNTRDLSLPHVITEVHFTRALLNSVAPSSCIACICCCFSYKFLSFNVQDGPASVIQRNPKLTLTRPKEPEFETAQRVRSVKIKSTAEIEEEMMAKIPKFKARPLNKKVFPACFAIYDIFHPIRSDN